MCAWPAASGLTEKWDTTVSDSNADTNSERLNDPMNPEVKAKWIAALLGTSEKKYKQGQQTLRRVLSKLSLKKNVNDDDASRYCCLGVLCDLYVEAGKGHWEFDECRNKFKLIDEKGKSSYGMPTYDVFAWAGMQHQDRVELDESDAKKYKDPEDKPTQRGFYFAEQNDTFNRKFKTIAKVIEKYL